MKSLQGQLEAMHDIVKQIKSDKEQAASQKALNALKQQLHATIENIKVSR